MGCAFFKKPAQTSVANVVTVDFGEFRTNVSVM